MAVFSILKKKERKKQGGGGEGNGRGARGESENGVDPPRLRALTVAHASQPKETSSGRGPRGAGPWTDRRREPASAPPAVAAPRQGPATARNPGTEREAVVDGGGPEKAEPRGIFRAAGCADRAADRRRPHRSSRAERSTHPCRDSPRSEAGRRRRRRFVGRRMPNLWCQPHRRCGGSSSNICPVSFGGRGDEQRFENGRCDIMIHEN